MKLAFYLKKYRDFEKLIPDELTDNQLLLKCLPYSEKEICPDMDEEKFLENIGQSMFKFATIFSTKLIDDDENFVISEENYIFTNKLGNITEKSRKIIEKFRKLVQFN